MSDNRLFQRLALLVELAERSKKMTSTLGRTSVMKLFFFLQESLGVPLGYSFSLYSYGPFDADVLSDLGTAERLSVLTSNVVYYSSGTGYEYRPGPDAQSVKELAADFLSLNTTSIDWVMTTFGRKSAGQLELLSTAIYIAKYQNPKSLQDLIMQVELIKPHFSHDQIEKGIQELISLQLLLGKPV